MGIRAANGEEDSSRPTEVSYEEGCWLQIEEFL